MSSSSWIYNSRRFNLDLPRKLQALIAAFNAKVTEDINDEGGEELQIRSEGGIGRSYLKFCDTELVRLDDSLTSTLVSTIQSCPTFEPDNDKLRCWVEFNNTGGYIPDSSNFSHHAKVYGVNRMHWGIRYGYGPLSLETVFDGRTNWGTIPDHTDLSIHNTDFTIQFRFAPYDLTMSSVHKQVVICKKDKKATDRWYSFEIHDDGTCRFNLSMDSLTKLSITTDPGVIDDTPYSEMSPTSTRYDVVVTYEYLTNTLKLYINNLAFTTVVNSIPSDANIPDYDGYDLMFGRWTALVSRPVALPPILDVDPIRLFSKLYFGVFQQFKYWKGKILTTTEIAHHYTNKVTISDIPFGEVAIPNGTLILT